MNAKAKSISFVKLLELTNEDEILEILPHFSRTELLNFLQWNDKNGTYTDENSLGEFNNRMNKISAVNTALAHILQKENYNDNIIFDIDYRIDYSEFIKIIYVESAKQVIIIYDLDKEQPQVKTIPYDTESTFYTGFEIDGKQVKFYFESINGELTVEVTDTEFNKDSFTTVINVQTI